jgi:shikimate dehydrogenase
MSAGPDVAGGTADFVASAVRACLAGELGVDPENPVESREVRVAGLGTTAPGAVKSAMLADALRRYRLELVSASARPAVADVLERSDGDLGLVLSPFKPLVGAALGRLTPSARATGIVDTLLRTPEGVLGLNTNSWALAAALGAVLPGLESPSILVLGAGGTTRSALLGLTRRWPSARITVSARRPEAISALEQQFTVIGVAPDDTPGVGADVVINSTTWGETAESEETGFGFPAGRLLRPGTILFDLNNRRSALQELALAGGCAVLSGTLMQRITHAARAAAVRWVLEREVR